jgi:hypothetical protein
MTTDELIEKLLDGTISSPERQQLQEQMAASPALAEEVHRLTVVEKLLTVEEEESEVATAVPFLRSVENTIAASIAVAGASQTAQVSSGGGFFRMLYAPLLVLLGGIGVFLAWPSSPENPASVQQQEQIDTPPSLSVQTPAVEETTPPVSTTTEAPTERTTVRPSAQPQEHITNNRMESEKTPDTEAVAITPSPENSASIEKNSNTTNKQLDQFGELHDAYTAHLQQGDNVKAAITAKSLGSLYRKQGDLQQAQVYLQSSLELSRKAHLPEYEAEALGELGLLANDNGNQESAREYISSCIELLRKSGATSSLQRWEKQLARLQK